MIKPINLGFGVVISMCAIRKKGQKWNVHHKNLDWAIKFIPKFIPSLFLAVFSGAHADVTLWDICEATPDTSGAFHWDDPDQDQWFEIARIIVDQMNR